MRVGRGLMRMLAGGCPSGLPGRHPGLRSCHPGRPSCHPGCPSCHPGLDPGSRARAEAPQRASAGVQGCHSGPPSCHPGLDPGTRAREKAPRRASAGSRVKPGMTAIGVRPRVKPGMTTGGGTMAGGIGFMRRGSSAARWSTETKLDSTPCHPGLDPGTRAREEAPQRASAGVQGCHSGPPSCHPGLDPGSRARGEAPRHAGAGSRVKPGMTFVFGVSGMTRVSGMTHVFPMTRIPPSAARIP